MTTWKVGALIALGVAFAASMRPAGYALGLGAALLSMGIRTWSGRDGR